MNIHAGGDAMRRREEILRVVGETAVHSQDELLAALRKRGFQVTQPTLSRDLRELGLVKTANGYVSPQALAPVADFRPRETREHRLEQLLHDSVVFAEAAANLVVIKTPVAAAQPLASAIDASPIEDALGTIGGDDTIFVAFRTPAAATAFARRVHQSAGLAPQRRRTRA
ncbi:MAG: arginine repressor [Acidobacteria bacterium]|nr:arginine repressor [Acidobacteriota bacterium]